MRKSKRMIHRAIGVFTTIMDEVEKEQPKIKQVKIDKKYIARIKVDGKTINLGVYNTTQEARLAIFSAKKIYQII